MCGSTFADGGAVVQQPSGSRRTEGAEAACSGLESAPAARVLASRPEAAGGRRVERTPPHLEVHPVDLRTG